MDIRVLRYFVATVRAQSISAGAEALHITQPTLSRQFIDLEEELRHKLFERSNRRIHLTPKGELFYERAKEILALVEKTKVEISAEDDDDVCGTITLYAAETPFVSRLAKILNQFHERYPCVCVDIVSGNEEATTAALTTGVADLGLFVGHVDLGNYDYIRLPHKDTWGLLTRKDGPLGMKSGITAEDLTAIPLLCSKQALIRNEFTGWLGKAPEELHIIGTFNLIYNAARLVEAGFGHALSLQNIYAETGNLINIPLVPLLQAETTLAWSKKRPVSRATEILLSYIRKALPEENLAH